VNTERQRFEAQVLPHLDAAYRLARWLSAAPGHAEDVVQDAALRAFRGFANFRGEDAKAWLFAIVRNCHYTAISKRRERDFVPLPDEQAEEDAGFAATGPGPEHEVLRRDDERTVQRLLATLPEKFREVLILRELEDMHYRDIALVAGIPIGTVMSRLARARAALKETWQRTMKETA
jgi:RNA polymerase sigma factor (sigma-70 family)